MPGSKRFDSKTDALRKLGTLHPRPEQVTDPLFVRDPRFFDPKDLLQVKYEMLRRVRTEGLPVLQAARAFGLSRPSFYQAQAAFDESGLGGLLPKKRGPRTRHKLTDTILEFCAEARRKNESLQGNDLVALVGERFSVTVHPRSLERALVAWEKKRR